MDNDSKKDTSVSISVIQFVDRAVENERRLNDAELGRLREVIKTQRDGDKEALVVAAQDVTRRLEAMNEFRAQITQERAGYLLKEMYDREHEAITKRVSELEIARGGYRGVYVALGAIFLIVTNIISLSIGFWKR